MKFTLITLTLCCCIVICFAAISEVKNGGSKTGDPKGRFLTLPVPSKCSNRKFYFIFHTLDSIIAVIVINYFSWHLKGNFIANRLAIKQLFVTLNFFIHVLHVCGRYTYDSKKRCCKVFHLRQTGNKNLF